MPQIWLQVGQKESHKVETQKGHSVKPCLVYFHLKMVQNWLFDSKSGKKEAKVGPNMPEKAK